MLVTSGQRRIALTMLIVAILLLLGTTILKPYMLMLFSTAGISLVLAGAMVTWRFYKLRKQLLIILAGALILVFLVAFFAGYFSAKW